MLLYQCYLRLAKKIFIPFLSRLWLRRRLRRVTTIIWVEVLILLGGTVKIRVMKETGDVTKIKKS
jgi:hypothetical protein